MLKKFSYLGDGSSIGSDGGCSISGCSIGNLSYSGCSITVCGGGIAGVCGCRVGKGSGDLEKSTRN
jgi:hypothetical protein